MSKTFVSLLLSVGVFQRSGALMCFAASVRAIFVLVNHSVSIVTERNAYVATKCTLSLSIASLL